MEKDIFYENLDISCKTILLFEEMYSTKKKEIINDLRKNLKEKYNIDINGCKEFDATVKAEHSDITTDI